MFQVISRCFSNVLFFDVGEEVSSLTSIFWFFGTATSLFLSNILIFSDFHFFESKMEKR